MLVRNEEFTKLLQKERGQWKYTATSVQNRQRSPAQSNIYKCMHQNKGCNLKIQSDLYRKLVFS